MVEVIKANVDNLNINVNAFESNISTLGFNQHNINGKITDLIKQITLIDQEQIISMKTKNEKPIRTTNQTDILRNYGKNVADISEGAYVTQALGNSCAMLRTDWTNNYDDCTCQKINDGCIQVNFRMAFEINTIRFLLWDKDNRHYRYRIEISKDGSSWESINARDPLENCSSWQTLIFNDTFVKFVKLHGTYNNMNENFHIVKFMAFYDYSL